MTGRVRVGLQLGTQPPLSAVRAALIAARAMRLDSVMVIDHFQNIFPTALWDQDFTWLAKRKPTRTTTSTTKRSWGGPPRGPDGCS